METASNLAQKKNDAPTGKMNPGLHQENVIIVSTSVKPSCHH